MKKHRKTMENRVIPIIDFSSFNSDNKKLRNSIAQKIEESNNLKI